jgi:hypothetical protein
MRRPIVFICVAFACLHAAPVHAQFISGNDLLGKLAGMPVESSFAVGYVTAVADARGRFPVLGVPPKSEGPFNLCFVIPQSATIGQIVAVSRQYIEQNPNTRHFPASGLVAAALAKAFPCER